MTKKPNLHRRAAAKLARRARDEQKAEAARREIAEKDRQTTRAAAARKLAKRMKKWKSHRNQVVKTRATPR